MASDPQFGLHICEYFSRASIRHFVGLDLPARQSVRVTKWREMKKCGNHDRFSYFLLTFAA